MSSSGLLQNEEDTPTQVIMGGSEQIEPGPGPAWPRLLLRLREATKGRELKLEWAALSFDLTLRPGGPGQM